MDKKRAVREERAEWVSFSLPGASVATSGAREGRQVEMPRVGHGIRKESPVIDSIERMKRKTVMKHKKTEKLSHCRITSFT